MQRLPRYLARYFLTGLPLSGKRQDNATMFRAATKDYRDAPTSKLSGPRWHRLARRWALLGVPALLGLAALAAWMIQTVYTWMAGGSGIVILDLAWTRLALGPLPPWVSWPWLRVLEGWWAAGLLGLGVWQLGRLVWQLGKGRQGRASEFVYPTWQAACQVLGVTYVRWDARRNVVLPDGFTPDAKIREPGAHSRLARWTGLAKLQDARALRRLEKERAKAESEELEETEEEPVGTGLMIAAALKPRPVVRKVDLEPAPSNVTVLDPPVRIYVPPGKCANVKAQAALLVAVGSVLGMPDPKAAWQLQGKRPYVELRPNRMPPPVVTFAAVRRHFEATDIDHPVIGLAAGNRPVTIDYLNNSPHVMASGGSGTGKSVLLKDLLCQRMHFGAYLVVLDYKRVSHRWAHQLPGCRYAWRIEELHHVAIECGALLEQRIENVLPDNDDTTVDLVEFPVVDILVEEINSLTPQLQTYWAEVRSPQDPAQSPAILAIKRIVNMGREYRMHVHICAQRASANVFGANGGDIRESFQTRLMARWTIQTWKMLAGGLPYQRCPSAGRGIWARVQGDDGVEIVRTPFLSNDEARSWAMSGTPISPDVLDEAGSTMIPGWSSPPPATAPALPQRTTLSESLSRLPGPPMTLKALRNAKDRGQDFPEPVEFASGANMYDLDELVCWKIERDRRLGLEIVPATPTHRPWVVYRFDVLYKGEVVCGYVGQTTRTLGQREEEHRGDKPWADLIVGSPSVVWVSETCTQDDLDTQELAAIRDLKPLFNYQGQEGAKHAIPKWTQEEERQARNRSKGLGAWKPVDVYGGRKSEVLRHGSFD
jgi:hypothetical protein